MSQRVVTDELAQELEALRHEIATQRPPESAAAVFERLKPLSIGLIQRVPILFKNTRMFRIRQMVRKPETIIQIDAPPPELATIQRLNEPGQSILYLADSPDTAFAESRSVSGEFCLSEWRVTAEKLVAANGGLTAAMLAHAKDIYTGDAPFPTPGEVDELI